MKKIVFIFLLFCMNAASAQTRHFLDTIRYDLKQTKRFYLSLDGKNNIVGDLNIKMFGLQGGYIYNRRTSLYMGLYLTSKEATVIAENYNLNAGKTDSNTIYNSYGMTYLNFGCEYIFCNNKKWQLSIPAAIGIGSGTFKRFSEIKYYEAKYPTIIPFETGLKASYKLTWWLWLGAGLGTRISLNSTHYYNGPFYTFGLQVKTGAMIKKAKKAIETHKKK